MPLLNNVNKFDLVIISSLEEGGATALGPALLMAVAMASQVKGSKVILCTDGQANVGLGSLEGTATSEELQERASEFYTDLSGFAVEKGCVGPTV